MMKQNNGITLVVLIITIIILLILAGISLSFILGDNGILSRTQSAVNEYEKAAELENNTLAQIDDYLANKLNEIGGNQNNTDQNYDTAKGVNKPKLTEGMLPVKYKDGNWVITNIDDTEWYDYKTKNWANVMLSDGKYKTSNPSEYTTDGTTVVSIADLGSMFVWIPRYAYQITNGYHSTTTGSIDVKFLVGTSNETEDNVTIVDYNAETTTNYTKFPDGYVVHPAFTSKMNKGGWRKEITGIWVAKFEAGYPMEGSIDNTSKTASNLYYPVFKGQRYSYNFIAIGDLFKLGKEMSSTGNPYGIISNSNSHMIKNSEWGAVTYLATSIYGKESEVYPNNVTYNGAINSIAGQAVYAITGYSGNSASAAQNTQSGALTETKGTSTVWYLTNGYEASTTGNITGIYDMSGGAFEYTGNVIPSGHSYITTYGGEIANISSSNEYCTLYPVGGSTSSATDVSRSYSAWGEMYGDAVWETSGGTGTSLAWNGDTMDADTVSNEPFLLRGGYWIWGSQAGLFCLYDVYGNGNIGGTSRVTLVAE